MANINRRSNYEEKRQALENNTTFSMAEILDVAELLRTEQWPDGKFGDNECNLWSALRRELNITFSNETRGSYNPLRDGAVLAIRIYFAEGSCNPMADLVLAYDHKKVTIDWVNVEQREMYEAGINGYTLIYDERPKRSFDEWN